MEEVNQELLLEQQQALLQAMAEEYQARLDDEMGTLHNRFVLFIAAAQIPLPQVLLVLKMVEREIIDQSIKQYLGE